jgi:hypothetical protein
MTLCGYYTYHSFMLKGDASDAGWPKKYAGAFPPILYYYYT